MSSSSSAGGLSPFTLLTGETSPNADVVASFKLGGAGGGERFGEQYMVTTNSTGGSASAAGHLIWDPTFSEGDPSLFSVAPVRLDISPQQVRWSVGTNEFLCCSCEPYSEIEKVQVAALATREATEYLIQWDMIELRYLFDDGRHERQVSTCLPKAAGGMKTRRSAANSASASTPFLQQFAEVSLAGAGIARLQLRGQVTLRSTGQSVPKRRPGPEDLQGKVVLFTKAS